MWAPAGLHQSKSTALYLFNDMFSYFPLCFFHIVYQHTHILSCSIRLEKREECQQFCFLQPFLTASSMSRVASSHDSGICLLKKKEGYM